MPYQFPLATVLRIRQLAVEQEERALAAILAQLQSLRSGLARADAELRASIDSRQQAYLAAPLPALHLQGAYAAAQQLRSYMEQLQTQIAQQQQLHQEQIARYEDAYRRREVLLTLRKEGEEAWRRAETKRENAAADEAFLNRHLRARQALGNK